MEPGTAVPGALRFTVDGVLEPAGVACLLFESRTSFLSFSGLTLSVTM